MNNSFSSDGTNFSAFFFFSGNRSESLPLRLKSGAVATSATMFAVGVLGNLIAIVVLCISKKEQKETTFYMLVCGMAVTDLLGTCFTSPVVIVTYVTNRWPGGELLCHFFSFSMLFFGSAGMSILCAMAVERYLAINHAYFYSQYVDRTMARLALTATYLANVVLCIMPSFGFGRHVKHFPGTWCFLDWRAMNPLAAAYSFLYGGVMLVLIAVTVLCNFAVCISLVGMSQRTRVVRAEVCEQDGSRRRFPKLTSVTSAAEIQMFWLLIFMTVVFLVCSIPLVVRIFVNQLHGPARISAGEKPDFHSDLLAIRFASFNPILDPWVYILCRKNLFVKGCERLKRASGIVRADRSRNLGWTSGQNTLPSCADSNPTSCASLRTGNFRRDSGNQTIIRTKSFTDFTVHQSWDYDSARPSFHPFSVE
ncbi:prostaglandin E receptor 4 (subtype EP4) c [Paramormyrops kingsleyae]|uniref:Prostaglandin E receptor 4 (subtype EP4) c n=1 Tax=Paramormyrops kingsleyae TaxID=1676925 RepID=A0A3B3S4V5_9TELE|nr:prostaglandin E2 receptor EP4 subtype-like [Paramormyrops kingsleyae]